MLEIATKSTTQNERPRQQNTRTKALIGTGDFGDRRGTVFLSIREIEQTQEERK
jgi:hypothetical protein